MLLRHSRPRDLIVDVILPPSPAPPREILIVKFIPGQFPPIVYSRVVRPAHRRPPRRGKYVLLQYASRPSREISGRWHIRPRSTRDFSREKQRLTLVMCDLSSPTARKTRLGDDTGFEPSRRKSRGGMSPQGYCGRRSRCVQVPTDGNNLNILNEW